MEQLSLIDYKDVNSNLWHGSFNGKESTLQQLSPYVGKLKSGMAKVLIKKYSQPGEIVLDPFSGSGVVPLESLLLGRIAFANDLSPYAYVLTRGKLEAPKNKYIAFNQAKEVINKIKKESQNEDIDTVPDWVKEFFHPNTLKEILVAFRVLKEMKNFFLMACLLGILHHIRPGFLSYPASHLVPYLRNKKYPPEDYPEMYTYRDLESRLLAKIERAYRRNMLPKNWDDRKYKVWQNNSMELPIQDCCVNTIISSPPYFGALDYARDNRLRLWFLGCDDWKKLDESLTANSKVYLPQMTKCLEEMYRVLKHEGFCVLVLGDVDRNGKTKNTAEILADIAKTIGFKINEIISDTIPDERRSRRKTKTTKIERILVMHK